MLFVATVIINAIFFALGLHENYISVAMLIAPPLLLPIILKSNERKFSYATLMINIIDTNVFAWRGISIVEMIKIGFYLAISIPLMIGALANTGVVEYVQPFLSVKGIFAAITINSFVYCILKIAMIDEKNTLHKLKCEYRLWSAALMSTVIYGVIKLLQATIWVDYVYYFFTLLVAAMRVRDVYGKIRTELLKQYDTVAKA